MIKFLVTGATGQLGREWVLYLEKNHCFYSAFSSVDLDITDKEAVASVLKSEHPDVVINCAAYTDVDGAESETEKAFFVNETGVINLTECCENLDIKLVHYSTDYVFPGKKEDRNQYPGGYPEEAKTDPVNTYGKSKEAGEKILKNAGCDWLLIRVAWLCGRFGSNFVKTMLRLGSGKKEISVIDDQTGSPSFAFDVVEKSHQLIKAEQRGVFHLNCKGEISWANFAEEIFQTRGMSVKINRITSDEYPFVAKRPFFSLLSIQKAEAAGLVILEWKGGLHRLLEQIGEN